jgi:hypothetical protein
MVDTVFEALVNDKSFSETCNFLRSHAIRHDQQAKEKNARQIHTICQPTGTTKKDKIKTVLALINELQLQDSAGSDEEVDISESSKTAMVCKLAQVPPEIWMALSMEAKKWLLNERKHQQQEDDKMKMSSSKKDTIKIPEKDRANPSNMPNQYAKVKNTVKREEELQDSTEQDYGFIDEFLEEAVNISNIYESQQETDYDYWTSDHNIHTSTSINNTLYNKCMNLLFLPEKYHISILDGGADTCVLGKGWEILSIHSSRRANVVGFDHETAIKRNLPIVSAITALDLPNGQSVLLLVHEGIYNETSNHSLLSEFQLREFGIVIDSICHRHGGAQQMIIKDNNHIDILTIPLDLAGCMVHFKHRLPTVEDMSSPKQYCLTHIISEICFHVKICEILYSKILSLKSYVWESVLRG